jgi:hypothetical protein
VLAKRLFNAYEASSRLAQRLLNFSDQLPVIGAYASTSAHLAQFFACCLMELEFMPTKITAMSVDHSQKVIVVHIILKLLRERINQLDELRRLNSTDRLEDCVDEVVLVALP